MYPADEVVEGLRKVVGDLRSKEIRTKNVYDAEDIANYIGTFSRPELPVKAKKLGTAVPLGDLTTTKATNRRPKPKPKPKGPRTTLIPKTCKISTTGRLNIIYNELLTMDVDTYPNACSVMLRVFVELGIDSEIGKRPHLKGKADPNTTLAKRLKELALDMKSKSEIDNDLQRAVVRIADTKGIMAANTATFNQFLHNRYVHPRPSELRMAWDELQPFMEKVLS